MFLLSKLLTVLAVMSAHAASVSAAAAATHSNDGRRLDSSVSDATSNWISKLTPVANADAFHMMPVRAIHARVQADAPVWDPTHKLFTSKYGDTFTDRFRLALDSVTTVSVEGALQSVQTDAIDYNLRSPANRCTRGGGVKFVVFYDVVIAQTNETLAQYENEYGPFVALEDGQCDPASTACRSINGGSGEPQLGAFVGAELAAADPRAPYPHAYRFSFANSTVMTRSSSKTEALRSMTRRGLCAFDALPDGVTCMYNYRIVGFIPLDDVVGITRMRNRANTSTYASFREFCDDGRVEFRASGTNGSRLELIDFWRAPQSVSENAIRATKLVDAYTAMLLLQKSTQVETTLIANTMHYLPTVAELSASNPPCYQNVKACSASSSGYGCKREFYSQQCRVCTANDTECTQSPSAFVYPPLAKALGSTAQETRDGAVGNDVVLAAGITGGAVVLMAVAVVAYRQHRRVHEPKLKAVLLSVNSGSVLHNLVERATHLAKPAVATPV